MSKVVIDAYNVLEIDGKRLLRLHYLHEWRMLVQCPSQDQLFSQSDLRLSPQNQFGVQESQWVPCDERQIASTQSCPHYTAYVWPAINLWKHLAHYKNMSRSVGVWKCNLGMKKIGKLFQRYFVVTEEWEFWSRCITRPVFMKRCWSSANDEIFYICLTFGSILWVILTCFSWTLLDISNTIGL